MLNGHAKHGLVGWALSVKPTELCWKLLAIGAPIDPFEAAVNYVRKIPDTTAVSARAYPLASPIGRLRRTAQSVASCPTIQAVRRVAANPSALRTTANNLKSMTVQHRDGVELVQHRRV